MDEKKEMLELDRSNVLDELGMRHALDIVEEELRTQTPARVPNTTARTRRTSVPLLAHHVVMKDRYQSVHHQPMGIL